MQLEKSVLQGDRLALTRLLTLVENESAEGQTALHNLFPNTGQAQLIGVTGSPGTGKSTLVNQLAHHYRNPKDGSEPQTVAIIAVDPSSPFSGGAVLGDRIRMQSLSGDKGVFIRSMATRGSLGGLAKTTFWMVQVFDAAGFDIIIIETVGAGQAEVGIARLAHTTLVVEAPGLGDDIQAIKAGILEIADILVVNKADRPGVESTERALKNMLNLAHPIQRIFQHHGVTESTDIPDNQNESGNIWIPPVLRTVATAGTGIQELVEAIVLHQEHLSNSGEYKLRERARLISELDIRLQDQLMAQWRAKIANESYDQVVAQLLERDISPQDAVSSLLNGASN